jgi:hypothetical protein
MLRPQCGSRSPSMTRVASIQAPADKRTKPGTPNDDAPFGA